MSYIISPYAEASVAQANEQFILYLTDGVSKVIEFCSNIFNPPHLIENKNSSMSYIADNQLMIERLATDKYFLKKPICVSIEILSENEYVAEFGDAGIAFSGNTASESVRELEVELIEVYELYKAEKCLGVWPRHQLTVLERYIGKKQ